MTSFILCSFDNSDAQSTDNSNFIFTDEFQDEQDNLAPTHLSKMSLEDLLESKISPSKRCCSCCLSPWCPDGGCCCTVWKVCPYPSASNNKISPGVGGNLFPVATIPSTCAPTQVAHTRNNQITIGLAIPETPRRETAVK